MIVVRWNKSASGWCYCE